MTTRALQIVPAGARQVAPGVFQMTRRGRGGGGRHHKHKHGPRRHQSLLAQRQIKYAAVLQFGRALQATQKINVPAIINFPALILYLWGKSKNDKGAVSTAKALQYDTVASSWGVGNMMQMAMSAAMSGGGLPGFGGGGMSGRQFQETPTTDSGGGVNATDTANAIAFLEQLNQMGAG